MERLFVYGTLHDEDVQMTLIGRTLESVPDVLSGYFRNENLFAPYPVAIPDDNAQINGHILEVTLDELTRLDEYEGENYIRICVTLESGLSSWVYIVSDVLLNN